MNCSKCNWPLPETCKSCRAEQQEKELDKKIHKVVEELVTTGLVEFEPLETDPNWWKLHLAFHKN